jgi:hypothetical protein
MEPLQMRNLFRKTISHPLRVFGVSLLWGLVEFMALQKCRWSMRPKRPLAS